MNTLKTIENLKENIADAETESGLLKTINKILDDTQQLISNNKLVNVNEYYNHIVSQLKTIDFDILKFIKEEDIKSMIKGSTC
jgi:uncharacterized protein (UPF0332 family)